MRWRRKESKRRKRLGTPSLAASASLPRGVPWEARDRVGLLCSVARVLARHKLNLQLAKVTTPGARVEDTFLIDGPELQQNKAQIAIETTTETELLEALAA